MSNTDINIHGLTAECLRDIARNESATRVYRKAAITLLMERDHKFQFHTDFRELREEIREEQEAVAEVQAIVESATEAPLQSINGLEPSFEDNEDGA